MLQVLQIGKNQLWAHSLFLWYNEWIRLFSFPTKDITKRGRQNLERETDIKEEERHIVYVEVGGKSSLYSVTILTSTVLLESSCTTKPW